MAIVTIILTLQKEALRTNATQHVTTSRQTSCGFSARGVGNGSVQRTSFELALSLFRITTTSYIVAPPLAPRAPYDRLDKNFVFRRGQPGGRLQAGRAVELLSLTPCTRCH